jgi:hypothetical protein
MYSLEISHILLFPEAKLSLGSRSPMYLIKPGSKNKISFLRQKILFSRERMDIKFITRQKGFILGMDLCFRSIFLKGKKEKRSLIFTKKKKSV